MPGTALGAEYGSPRKKINLERKVRKALKKIHLPLVLEKQTLDRERGKNTTVSRTGKIL